jgi:hypothetical protein
MKKHAKNTAPCQTLRAFAESDDDAAFRLFAQLCRSSPALREWLWEEFARKPKTRAKIAATPMLSQLKSLKVNWSDCGDSG